MTDRREKQPVRELTRRLEQLRRERATFEPFWQDVKQYIVPHRGRFLGGESPWEVNNGGRNDEKIINGAATRALEVMTSGMQSGLTSKAREWFSIGHPDRRIADLPQSRQYYTLLKRTLLEAFDRSNLYSALLDVYNEMGAFGTAAMAILPHPEHVFFFRSFTVGSYFLSFNHRQEPDAFFMFDFLTVKQMADEYGEERLSDRVREMHRRGILDERVKVFVAVLRDPELYGVRVPSGMPVAEVHWEDGTPPEAGQRKLLAVRGYRGFPVVTPRWATVGQDVYGWSPARTVLGNVKMLQMMERDKLQGLRKMVDPPLQGPMELERRGINASPGGYNTVSTTGEGIRPLYLTNPDIDRLNLAINQVTADIQKGFYNDLFMMLQQRDMINNSQMTAREVEERSWEKMLALGPVLERIHYELLNPLIDRCIQMLYFAGRIPAPPEEMLSAPSKIEYISILSQAQKAVSVRRNESLMSYIGSIMGIFPEARHKVDVGKAVDDYAEAVGANPELVVDAEQFQQQLARDAQMQQLAQQTQIGGNMASAAKVASEMDQSGLNQIIENLTGAGGGRMVV